MKARSLLSIYLIINTIASSAQTVFNGRIIDGKSNEPIAGAFVCASHQQKTLANCLSDTDGHFHLEIKSDEKEIILTVSIMGYEIVRMTPDKNEGIVIRLKEQNIAIKAARIRTSAVEENGDTVIYSAGAFKEKTDRSLGDLLKRLPGITVTQNGGVLYNGSYINKFYIEGLDLMGVHYGIATKNLNVESISNVQIYKNHQPIKALEGLENTEKAAVNIILKESSKGIWMFNGNAALGWPDFPLFNAKAMLSRFSKSKQDLILAKGNNIGDDIIKELQGQRYFGRIGAFLISENGFDLDFDSKLSPRKNILDMPKEYWYGNTSGTLTANHLQKTSKGVQFKTSLSIGTEKYNESQTRDETIQFNDKSEMRIIDNSSMTDKSDYAIGSMNWENNGKRTYLYDNFSFSGQVRRNDSRMDGAKGYEQNYRLPSLKLHNSLLSTARLSENKAINLSSDTRFIRNSHNAAYSTDKLNVEQSVLVSDFKSVNDISFKIKTGRSGIKVSVNGGLDVSYIDYKTELDGTGIGASSDSFNAFIIKAKGGVTAYRRIHRTEISVKMPASYSALVGNYGKTELWPEMSPSVSARIRLTDKINANAIATYTLSKSQPEYLAKGDVMTNYRTISTYGVLSGGSRLNVQASIRYSDLVNMLSATMSANYSRKESDHTTSNQYSEDITYSSIVPFNSFLNNYGGSLALTKYFGIKTLTIDANVTYNHTTGRELLQGDEYNFTADNWISSITLKTNATQWIHSETSVRLNQRKENNFTNMKSQALSLTESLQLFPIKKLTLGAELFYSKYWLDSGKIDNHPIIKVYSEWKLKKVALFAECRNILDINEISQETLSSYRILRTSTSLRGREFIVGLRMEL